MDKLKGFIIFDGLFVGGGLLFFLYMILNRRSTNQFKDDLWQEVKPLEGAPDNTAEFVNQRGHRIRIDEAVDRKLQLEAPFEATAEASQSATNMHGNAGRTKPEATKSAPYAFPKFRGKAHEVLGIPLGATPDTIVQAHRYWIKRYHPDRVARINPEAVNQAQVRAEQLNRARADLLREVSKLKK